MQSGFIKKAARISAVTIITAFFVAWITPSRYYQMALENEFIKGLKKKLTAYNKDFPEDRVYLQFDKPMYEPGETIWFSANVLNAKNMLASEKSDILHVEFISPKGSVERTIKLITNDGKTFGDFELDKEALGGIYKVRAYTNWMKNAGDDNVFEKEIQVQQVILPKLKMKLDFEKKAFGAGDEVVAKLQLNTNDNKPLSDYKIRFVANVDGQKVVEKADITDEEGIKFITFNLPADLKSNDGLLNVMIDYNGSTESVSRSIPIVLNKIDLALLPEGGELVEGLQTNVAIKAINEFGKPADVEGIVVDSKGNQMVAFSSYHDGMGAFAFTPKPNEIYKAKITKPEGIKETYPLPEVLKRGYVLNIDNSNPAEIKATIRTTETEQLSLIAQVRGEIYYSTAIDSKKGDNSVVFPTDAFPAGVVQVTLFDAKGIQRAERLAFVNQNKQLQVKIETDKDKYQPREKVTMTVSVKDEKGMPSPANLTVAVVNDQFLSFADDKSGNILSQLLLQQDLKTKVEEPAFYFDPKEEKATKALDYLLMTSGWRRFTWEQINKEEKPLITFKNEKTIVTGVVMDGATSKPLAKAKVKVGSVGDEVITDANGKFTFTKIVLTSPVSLNTTADGFAPLSTPIYEYTDNLAIYMYKPVPKPTSYPTYMAGNGIKKNVPRAKNAEAVNEAIDDVAQVPGVAMDNMAAVNNVAAENNAGPKKGKKDEDKAQLVNAEAQNANNGIINLDADIKANFAWSTGGLTSMNQSTAYYRGREFYAPKYKDDEVVETRTDFRNTLYWNPNVSIDHTGKKTLEFSMSDDISSFRATAEGISGDGTIGRAEKTFYSQLPFAMSTKIPLEVATEDVVSIPLTLTNNTNKPLGGKLSVTAPAALRAVQPTPEIQTIMPGASKTIFLDYNVSDLVGTGDFTITFKACGLGDAFSQKIRISPKGFPASIAYSAQELDQEYNFFTKKVVRGSLRGVVTAFPNVVSDLMQGIEGILREPYGCFEQTSMSAYPNAMVLDYLQSTGSDDQKTITRAKGLLDKGYKRLTTFETKEKGYEWFGSNPGHEALTAYGLMEFTDMKHVGEDVDAKMMDRTADWLMSRKDGKGGFLQNPKALDNFGRASKEVTDAYIVYSLSEAGYTNITKEFLAAYDQAMLVKDPYTLALVTNAAFNLKDTKRANDGMKALLKTQNADGSFKGDLATITYSQGQSQIIETTSLAVLAMMKDAGKNGGNVNKTIEYLVGTRNSNGTFGNTQGTVLALKALTEYAKSSKSSAEDGTIQVFVDGKKAAEHKYKGTDKEPIVMDSLEKFLVNEGKHIIEVKFVGVKTALPYTVAVNWSTALPESNSACVVDLKTNLATNQTTVGETVRLSSVVTNKTPNGIPATMVIIGIPAGFTVQPWQLKEMQEKKIFDYYEMKGNNVAIYYRCLEPSAVRQINFDLKAEMPGEYDAPASSAYLYYTNELKTWSGVDKVTIKKAS